MRVRRVRGEGGLFYLICCCLNGLLHRRRLAFYGLCAGVVVLSLSGGCYVGGMNL